MENNTIQATPVREVVENISDFLISEEAPYFLPITNTSITVDGHLTTTIGHVNEYRNEEFGKLLQTISTIGSCCLSKRIQAGVKQYFLGEKLRIRKCSYSIADGVLKAVAHPTVQTNRKGKAIIDIFDVCDALAYRFELDYNVFSQQTFEKLFKQNYNENGSDRFDCNMPGTANRILNNHSFIISIGQFNREQCLGHFSNHPIVPAVFIVKCLLAGIKNWFATELSPLEDMNVDSLEIFPNKAMPIETEFDAAVLVEKLSSKVFMFTCKINDKQQNEYGVYPITIQI